MAEDSIMVDYILTQVLLVDDVKDVALEGACLKNQIAVIRKGDNGTCRILDGWMGADQSWEK